MKMMKCAKIARIQVILMVGMNAMIAVMRLRNKEIEMSKELLEDIEILENGICSIARVVKLKKREYLKSKGWDVQLIDEFAEIYFYMKGSYNVTCEDEAMRVQWKIESESLNQNCPGCDTALTIYNLGCYRDYCEKCVDAIPIDFPTTNYRLKGKYPNFEWCEV
jgi:hypothetical protein